MVFVSNLLKLMLTQVLVLLNSSDGLLRPKRNDIDLQTCINNFDIHRDKIIRTQDSQNMGAKYLNEFDLGTREECLRLCCETEDCDVFVFEEKNSGSCYLFHCGPPEDFKCKFTHHVNYSSAVLAINRHLPDLESQIKLTKHEQDLNKLRKPEIETEQKILTSTTSTAPSTTIKSKEILPVLVESVKKNEEARKCSRYQFECRSTSECIAIYNACDGIPQCADGSDEAPELGCPPDSPTTQQLPVRAVNNPPQPPPPPRYDSNIQSPARLHPLQPILSQPEIYRPPIPQQQELAMNNVQQIHQQQQQENSDFLRPIQRNGNNQQRLQFEGVAGQYAPVQQPVANGWMQHQTSNQLLPPQIAPYADKNSHIFTHKENGLQVADGQEIRYNKHKGAMQYLHRALGYSNAGQMQYGDGQVYNNAKLNNYYNYRPIAPENWASNPAEDPAQFNAYQPEVLNNKEWHQDVDAAASGRKDGGFKTTSVMDHPFGSNKENPKHEQDKMAHELKHSKENMEHVSSEQEVIPKIKIEKHKEHPPETLDQHQQHYPDVVAYKVDDRADGIAETPSGAVLSLTLGLILTCIMALLIGCRLRVKRRMRKGGKSYAHDADYLVNGMYL